MERLVTWGIAVLILLAAVTGLVSLVSVRHAVAPRHEAPAGRADAYSPPTVDLQGGRPAAAASAAHGAASQDAARAPAVPQ